MYDVYKNKKDIEKERNALPKCYSHVKFPVPGCILARKERERQGRKLKTSSKVSRSPTSKKDPVLHTGHCLVNITQTTCIQTKNIYQN